ncbi:SIS domain-containing protein [Alteromonas sp. CYL-A6]|uniref:SIS domain-containing protein n=1 Tax=Alteromonas nitratireducens TaxID=3390813 RepID=UPI0034A8200A
MNTLQQYSHDLKAALDKLDYETLEILSQNLFDLWRSRRRLFICGNGGSAGNAIHIANDFTYGINPHGLALDVEALPANPAVMTCLANDIGYQNAFSHQLKVKAQSGDILIVLSGSGNSPNIVKALRQAKLMGVTSFAIVGFDGGEAKHLADYAIHVDLNDMQIAEDIQVIIGHMMMKSLFKTISDYQKVPLEQLSKKAR